MINEITGNEKSNSFKINNPKNKEVPIERHLFKWMGDFKAKGFMTFFNEVSTSLKSIEIEKENWLIKK